MIIAIYLTPTQFECGFFSVWVISIKIKLHVHVSSIQILNKILIANKSQRNFSFMHGNMYVVFNF